MITKTQRIFTYNSAPVEDADFNLASFDLADAALMRALRDARQTRDTALQQEALTWLWICCPDIADELGMPATATGLAVDADKGDRQPVVVDYLHHYSTFSLA